MSWVNSVLRQFLANGPQNKNHFILNLEFLFLGSFDNLETHVRYLLEELCQALENYIVNYKKVLCHSNEVPVQPESHQQQEIMNRECLSSRGSCSLTECCFLPLGHHQYHAISTGKILTVRKRRTNRRRFRRNRMLREIGMRFQGSFCFTCGSDL